MTQAKLDSMSSYTEETTVATPNSRKQSMKTKRELEALRALNKIPVTTTNNSDDDTVKALPFNNQGSSRILQMNRDKKNSELQYLKTLSLTKKFASQFSDLAEKQKVYEQQLEELETELSRVRAERAANKGIDASFSADSEMSRFDMLLKDIKRREDEAREQMKAARRELAKIRQENPAAFDTLCQGDASVARSMAEWSAEKRSLNNRSPVNIDNISIRSSTSSHSSRLHNLASLADAEARGMKKGMLEDMSLSSCGDRKSEAGFEYHVLDESEDESTHRSGSKYLNTTEEAAQLAEEAVRKMRESIRWLEEGTLQDDQDDTNVNDTSTIKTVPSIQNNANATTRARSTTVESESKMPLLDSTTCHSGSASVSAADDDNSYYKYYSEEHQKEYYYNPKTEKIVWTRPAKVIEDDANEVSSYTIVADCDDGRVTLNQETSSRDGSAFSPKPSCVLPQDEVPISDFSSRQCNKATASSSLKNVKKFTPQDRGMHFSEVTPEANATVAVTPRRTDIAKRRRRRRKRKIMILAFAGFLLLAIVVYFRRAHQAKVVEQERLLAKEQMDKLAEENERLRKEAEEKERLAEQKRKTVLKRKLKEEKERQAAEDARKVEEARLAAEKEEQRLLAERKAAEQRQFEEEQSQLAEKARLEAERKAAEQWRLEEQRQMAEKARLEAERLAAEQRRLEEEKRKREEERRLAEALRAEAERLAAEEYRLEQERLASEEEALMKVTMLVEEKTEREEFFTYLSYIV